MATESYVDNRSKYHRPQGLLFANDKGTLTPEGVYVPDGEDFKDFIILTDDNRSEITVTQNRIETKERMINGRMRSYHTADKLKISVDWKIIPSRAFDRGASNAIDSATGLPLPDSSIQFFTTDRGAAGSDILTWYETHVGSFWMFLSYDNPYRFPKVVDDESDPFGHMQEYAERYEVFFESFDYTVTKRGKLYDFWNVKLALEEA